MDNANTGERTDLMSCDEAAEYARVSAAVIRIARSKGYLVGYLPNGHKRGWRYRREDLNKWLLGTSSV